MPNTQQEIIARVTTAQVVEVSNTPANGDVPVFNSSTGTWVADAVSGGGGGAQYWVGNVVVTTNPSTGEPDTVTITEISKSGLPTPTDVSTNCPILNFSGVGITNENSFVSVTCDAAAYDYFNPQISINGGGNVGVIMNGVDPGWTVQFLLKVEYYG